MEKFKEIHTNNSKYLGDDDYFELLSPKNRPDANYNSAFLEAKNLILKKFPRETYFREDSSFIIYSKHLHIFTSYYLSEEGSPLPLKVYLNFLESSKDYLDYMKKLRANTFHLTIFKLDRLNGFCNDIVSDYIDNVVNIKEIEYENKYLYSEPKDFQKIENKYQEVNNGKRLNTEKLEDSEKIDFSKNKEVFEEFLIKVCDDYEVKELKKHLDVIIKDFGKIRNDFKGQPNTFL
ncbi:331_t:CDS:2 [Ambispora leptoticha]|uniref:331_t:CDS:1 n=1 Tax=Ambispora leptoticha TaxID=144679 RepID=A0A9N9FUE2_9GLOM|nr:331_t:CDS:2 [Ambispora leptoticha]